MLKQCLSSATRLASRHISREQILNKLEHVLGSRNVISDPVDTAPFNVDWKGMHRTRSAGEENRNEQSIVVTPRGTEETVALMRLCHQYRIPGTVSSNILSNVKYNETIRVNF